MPSALAIAAHPDDIEFAMAGTLFLLQKAGWDLHYFNLSSGDLGSTLMPNTETARVRRREARAAAKTLGAKWHAPICHDLRIFYTERNLRSVTAVVRATRPSIVLTHALQDYMEDHMITARLAVTATFARGMPNFRSVPPRRPVLDPVTVYHAMPHGLRTPLRAPVIPDLVVNTASVQEEKRAALGCHASQQQWLDETQGMDSYLGTMDFFSREVATFARGLEHAEGWSRHLHYGFGAESDDPLRSALSTHVRNAQRNKSKSS